MYDIYLECGLGKYHISWNDRSLYELQLFCLPLMSNTMFNPAMTAFTDQYSLPNICFDIGQL